MNFSYLVLQDPFSQGFETSSTNCSATSLKWKFSLGPRMFGCSWNFASFQSQYLFPYISCSHFPQRSFFLPAKLWGKPFKRYCQEGSEFLPWKGALKQPSIFKGYVGCQERDINIYIYNISSNFWGSKIRTFHQPSIFIFGQGSIKHPVFKMIWGLDSHSPACASPIQSKSRKAVCHPRRNRLKSLKSQQ